MSLKSCMKIVIAMDSFKGTFTAAEACEIVAQCISESAGDTEIVVKPMANGGEGTARAMIAAKNGEWIKKKVMGPLPKMQVDAGFAWFAEDKTALVEMAAASGLELLSKEQLNPLKTTTYGTGQLIKAAIEHGAERILLTVGGSATVDGGVGAAIALDWEFLDQHGNAVPLGGFGLGQIERIVKPEKLNLPAVEVLCDVDNPLCGEQGAAKVYGPQKGADAQMVEQLESNLSHLAKIVKGQLNKDIKDIPGCGAAGGLSAGAVAFMEAGLVSGIETIMDESSILDELKSADWVITGEGCFDQQSLRGKVVSGLAKAASKTRARIAVLAGQVSVSGEECEEIAIAAAIPCKKEDMSLDYALENCRELLYCAAQEFVERYFL